MARGYRRLSLPDEDEIWERLRPVMPPNRQPVRWGSRPGRSAPISCGAAGSGLFRGEGPRDG
jgi:hypothetical protein